MPTQLDTILRDEAFSLINNFGQAPTSYHSVSQGAFNVALDTGSTTRTARTGFKVSPPTIMSEGFASSRSASQSSRGALLQVGEALTYIAAKAISGWAPSSGDEIVFSGISHKYVVLRARPIISGELVAVFELTCKAVTDGESV